MVPDPPLLGRIEHSKGTGNIRILSVSLGNEPMNVMREQTTCLGNLSLKRSAVSQVPTYLPNLPTLGTAYFDL